MSWWNPGGIFTGGVDMDAEIERGQRLDQETVRFNRQQVAEGKMSEQEFSDFQNRNEWAGEQYNQEVADAFWEGAQSGWDRMTAPVSSAVSGAKKALTWYVILQACVLALAIWLAYKYFKGGGKIPI